MTEPDDPDRIVYVDASFRHAGSGGGSGIAGLGVVGALGEHRTYAHARSSLDAEIAAVRFAWSIAKEQDARALTFRTDCDGAARAFAQGKPSRGWTVELVRRTEVADAHNLARKALREATAPEHVRTPPRTREWLEANPVPRWSPAGRVTS
jgi:ribonuclease HI